MESAIFDAALAGLVHDLGKILQRSRHEPWKAPDGYEREGQPVHARWSEYLIEGVIPKPYQRAAYQGVYHHQPEKSPAEDRSLSALVALADKLSAGERSDMLSEEKGSQLPQQMLSIFTRIEGTSKYDSPGSEYLPLKPLELKKDHLFPAEKIKGEDSRKAYEELKKALTERLEGLQKLDSEDGETFLENLLFALQSVAWCIPSAYYHSIPDVSLYDHSRMTAALAVCLSDLTPQRVEKLLEAVRADFQEKAKPNQNTLLDEPATLLVGGDISGIQDFLYTLSSRRAAKTLRGRSLYLQLLTEAVLRFTLRELGIPYTNVIYSGGGHFYLLAPLSAAQSLVDIQRNVSRILLKHHGTALYLAIGSTEVSASGFRRGKFPAAWQALNTALAQTKLRRYQELGDQMYSLVFSPNSHGGNQEKTCSVCGMEKQDTSKIQDEESSEVFTQCGLCESFADLLGKHLPNTVWIQLQLGQPEQRSPATAFDTLAEFGTGVAFLDQDGKSLFQTGGLARAERAVLWTLDDLDKDKAAPASELPTARATHYMVKHIPSMTFDEMAKKAEGIKRLGVLRMDVDDLGAIFHTGFGERDKSIATLSRLSTLSFQMGLFFEGWVKQICKQTSDMIYAVYSGGDDLFLIAPWNIVPDLAKNIVDDFSAYVALNPNLHISGGMAFIHGKYPVYQAADDAGEALEQAKSNPGKNAFSFLGQVYSWQDFDQLASRQQQLIDAVINMKGSNAILQLLQRLAIMQADKRKRLKKRPVWGRWMWLGDYQLQRMIETAEKEKKTELTSALEELRSDLTPYYDRLPAWGVAARWAQLLMRKKNEK